MTLDLFSIPLAAVAGMLSIMSPCVWPLVPVVMSSAATSGRSGPYFLALGLSFSFAVAGTALTMLLHLGLDPELFRYFAGALLLAIALLLLVPSAGEWATQQLSRLVSGLGGGGDGGTRSPLGQFGVGALLGLVWLPCVGPTLGAAIGLASMGQDVGMAFAVMFTFGLGTTSVLLLAGLASGKLLARWRPEIMTSAEKGKKILGWMLLLLAVLVITGFDKMLEAWALGWLPDWAILL